MVCLDDNSPFVGAKNSEFFGGMFDDGDVTFGVGNEEVFGNGARDTPKSVEGLTSSVAVFGNVADKMGRRKSVVPFVDMGIGEADIKSVLIDSVFGIEFASIFAEATTPDAFVREEKMTIGAGKRKLILFKEFAGGGFPVIVTANEGFAFFADSEDSAAVGVLKDALFLVIDERSNIFIEEKFGVETDGLSSRGDFRDEGGVEFLINLELATEGGRVEVGVKIMMVSL